MTKDVSLATARTCWIGLRTFPDRGNWRCLRLHLLLLLFLIPSIPAPVAQAAERLASFARVVQWESIIGPEIHLSLSIFGGPSPYKSNSDEEFAPASISKLFTASLALEKLGADFRFETQLKWRRISPEVAADLTLVGSGDPTWGVDGLVSARQVADQLASQLAARGIRTVRGPIQLVAGDPRWDTYRDPIGWDGTTCSYAPPLAFTINGNCLSDQRILDSRPLVQALLVAALQAQGMRWANEAAPRGGTEVSVSYYSPPLELILVPFLKQSINVIGEALLRKVGERSEIARRQDLLEAGQQELAEFVAHLGERTAAATGRIAEPRFFSSRVILYDGSGLSRASRVTGDATIALLRDLLAAPGFERIWRGLPVAGVDGTLKERMKGTAAQGVLRAKTGTLKGVYNLAGYVPRFQEGRILEVVPFAVLTKDAPSMAAAHLIEDQIGSTLAEVVQIGNSGLLNLMRCDSCSL